MSEDGIIFNWFLFLHNQLSSSFMFIVWFIPFLYAAIGTIRRRSKQMFFVTLLCVPFLIYFGWAMTGLWSEHIVALVFNRSAQIVAVIIVLLLTFSLWYECK